jgi:hypothetical protein
MRHGTARRRGGLVAAVIALAGCAVEPGAPAAVPAVTALASAPDAAGLRTWWIFRDGRGDAVRAPDLAAALRVVGVVGVHPREVKVTGGEGDPLASSYVTTSVGIGGGGR